MAVVKPVLSVQNKVVADELNLGVVRLSGLDVDVGEGKVVARAVLGAVHPEDSVVERVSGKVVHVNVIPFKVSLSWVVEIGEIGEPKRGNQIGSKTIEVPTYEVSTTTGCMMSSM